MPAPTLAELLQPRDAFGSQSESVESLGAFMRGELTSDWLETNYPTRNLETVVGTVFKRLDGVSGKVGFHLAQSMGGGKTHTLLCLGLLSKDPRLLRRYFPGIGIGDDRPVKTVCFDGRENHSLGMWGTIAKQLGKESEFSEFYGPYRAPGVENWRRLFDGERVLVLIDELPFYLDNALATQVGDSNLSKVTSTALTTLMGACADGPETRKVGLVMTDLNPEAYPEGSDAIQQATVKVLQTLGGERDRILENLQPIELETNDLYHILRRRLFKEDPDPDKVRAVTKEYQQALRQASDNAYCTGDPVTLAADMKDTYPFNPGIKHLAARFRTNTGFQQTRGMIRLFSKVVRHLYQTGKANEIRMIGPEHIDLADDEIRDQVKRINSHLEPAISRDFYQTGSTANLQQIDTGSPDLDCATVEAARIIFFSSLSEQDSQLGLDIKQLGTWFAAPNRDITLLPKVWEAVQDHCDYLHQTDPDNKLLFRPVENILVWVKSRAANIGENAMLRRLSDELSRLFKPESSSAYQRVEALPNITDLSIAKDKTTLVILRPQQREALPGDVLQFWQDETYKNRLLFLTGIQGGFNRVQDHIRSLMATEEALGRPDIGETERKMVEQRKERAREEFREALIHCYNTLFFPVSSAELNRDSLRLEYGDESFKGCRQITALLEEIGKFQPWDERSITSNRDYAQNELFDNRTMRWSDILENAAIRPSWPFTDTGWLDRLKNECLRNDYWREVGTDQIEHGPFKKVTKLHVRPRRQEEGRATLELRPTPQTAVVRYCVGDTFDPEHAIRIEDRQFASFETDALKLTFRCEDPDGQYQTGEDEHWQGKPVLKKGRNPRLVELEPTHDATIWYTTDGSRPEPGACQEYQGPFNPPENASLIQAVAVVEGIPSEIIEVPVGQTPQRKGRTTFSPHQALARTGVSPVQSLLTSLRESSASIRAATLTFVLGDESRFEVQAQDGSFSADFLLQQIETIGSGLTDPPEALDDRSLDVIEVVFPSPEAFDQFIAKEGIHFDESKEVSYGA